MGNYDIPSLGYFKNKKKTSNGDWRHEIPKSIEKVAMKKIPRVN